MRPAREVGLPLTGMQSGRQKRPGAVADDAVAGAGGVTGRAKIEAATGQVAVPGRVQQAGNGIAAACRLSPESVVVKLLDGGGRRLIEPLCLFVGAMVAQV